MKCITPVVFFGAASTALASGTVTVSLGSLLDGQVVNGGTPVLWTIAVQASSQDNLGLAMISVDLVQSMNNPAFLDMTPNPTPPTGALAYFARPMGVSNPDSVVGAATFPGYNGSPRGPIGAKNLVQIGGAQNTLGSALGADVGTSTTIQLGVGQSSFPLVIATGMVIAPCVGGQYRLSLIRASANTIDSAANDVTLISPASVSIAVPSITFSVNHSCPADFNCSGGVTPQDIFDFLNAWFAGDPRSDFNGSGTIEPQDIFDYLNAWFMGC